MKFKLKEGRRFRVGVTSFECKKGKVINVRQSDTVYRKVLIDFGNDLVDWFSESILDKYFEAV